MTWLLSCTSSSNIPGLPQTAWIDVSYAGWRGSIEKTVGGYEFGGIKRQYGFSMAGAGDDLVWPGVHFQSPPHIRSCCCLHPAKIGHHSFAFPREKFSFLIHLFPYLQRQIMSCVKNSEILDILSYTKMEYTMFKKKQNGHCIYSVRLAVAGSWCWFVMREKYS